MEHFVYDDIVELYNSSGVVIPANVASHTTMTDSIILQLRADVDYLGELCGMQSYNSSWDSNGHFNWEKGTTLALDTFPGTTTGRPWMSIITNFRTACENLYTKKSLGAPSWTILTANLKTFYENGSTATISSGVLTETSGVDFTDVVDGKSRCSILGGTGVTEQLCLVTNHTITPTQTLTLSPDPGNSSAGDVSFRVSLNNRLPGSYTKVRKTSLYQDVRDALIAVSEAQYIYVSNAGDDGSGDGSFTNPYETWDKAVQVVGAGGGIYFFNGDYLLENTQLASKSGVTIHGQSLGGVTFDNRINYFANNSANMTIENIVFVRGSSSFPNYVIGCNNMTINNCILTENFGSTYLWFGSGTGCTFNHCTFIPRSSVSRGCYLHNAAATFNDCIFYNMGYAFYVNSTYSGNLTTNNCGFYNIETGRYFEEGGSSMTPVETGNLTSDPEITNATTAYLSDTSPYKDQATDSFDIGAHEIGPYNVIRTASDVITVSDTVIDKRSETADDLIIVTEGLTETNMSLTVAMFLGGLFESSSTGVITYKGNGEVTAPNLPSFTYSGASLDVSFDNVGGDACRVYIAVDDGVSQYSSLAWWTVNADIEAISTTNAYAIDINTECILGGEFGDQYDLSTMAADGVNDQQADITLKLRVHNVVKDEWSELVTVSKSYYFNDFDQTMYYCADNPRVIDDEYANHANYYAQTYHTGTAKYTRPDGVDWANDSRRFAYNTMFKSDRHIKWASTSPVSPTAYGKWQDRKSGGLQPAGSNTASTELMLFACIFTNFGNWNYSGDHCFIDTTHQPYDKGTGSLSNPVFSTSPSSIHYIHSTAVEGSDCSGHGSHSSIIVRFPSGENVGWGSYHNKPDDFGDNDFYYQQGDNPYTGCGGNKFYFWAKDNSGSYIGPHTAWMDTKQVWYANTDDAGNYSYGRLASRKYHTGGINFLNSRW